MRRTITAFVLVFGTFASAMTLGAFCTYSTWASSRDPYLEWDTLARAFHELQTRYIEELDTSTLIYSALNGVVDSLDPHSSFMTPEQYKRFQEDESSSYYGIGATVQADDHGLRVADIIPGSPASRVAMEPGDLIISIDGTSISGEPFQQSAQRLQGDYGAPVCMGIQRGDQQRQVTLQREWIHLPAAMGTILDNDLGLLTIAHFREGASNEVKATVANLEAQTEHGLKGLVIDLRDNPGGLLREAVDVVDIFVGNKLIVSTRGRALGTTETLSGTDATDDIDIPLVIIVNRFSASAAEIVAGSLRDLHGAVLLGTPTYGKGSVQTLRVFEDGSALKFTISSYYLPGGEPIPPKDGLLPDITVMDAEELAYEELVEGLIRQVDADAIIDESSKKQLLNLLSSTQKPLVPRQLSRRWSPPPIGRRLESDIQLARAVETLRRQLGQ